jgi:hypothetical protein
MVTSIVTGMSVPFIATSMKELCCVGRRGLIDAEGDCGVVRHRGIVFIGIRGSSDQRLLRVSCNE